MRSFKPAGPNRLTERLPDGAVDFQNTTQEDELQDRAIGDIIKSSKDLSDEQITEILEYQKRFGLRFGEAAVRLGYASNSDVVWALSKQFHYPYTQADATQRNPELISAVDPFGEQAEAFRELRSQLIQTAYTNTIEKRAIAVLSPDVGDGKSFFAANLAVGFSQLGGRTLLIDADMRTPRQHEIFDIVGDPGLSNVLSGRADQNVVHQVKGLPSLYVLPVGPRPPNPLELVQRTAFGVLLQELVAKFDYVIVDTPALQYGADARVIAAKCGAALAIGRRGKTKYDSMKSLLTALKKGPAQVAGVVINDW